MRKSLAVLFSLLLATSLAACGDDGDDESGSPSASASGTDDDVAAGADDGEGEGGETTDETATPEDGDDAGGEDTGDDGTDEPVGEPADPDSEFCQQANVFATDTSLGDLDFSDPADLETGVSLLESFRDAAPEEIADDLQVIVDGFEAVATALAEAGTDPAAQAAAAEELQDDLAALSEASANVQQFTMDQCGIDITGGTTEATP